MEAGERRVVPCPDPRCALSFDSIQDLQCHFQDVHCVERIKRDPIKRRRLTHQSSLNVKAFPVTSIKLEHHCNLLNEESPYKHVIEIMDSPIFEPVDITVPAGPVGLEEHNSVSQSYPLLSIETKANQEKRGPSASSFTSSENPLSMTDWTSDETALDNPTPASSVYSDPPLSIDPRLLNESDTQPIMLPE